MFRKKKTVCAIEIGVTTAAVAFSNELGKFIWKKKGIPTAFPIRGEDSIKMICSTIKEAGQKYSAIGIAFFGPLKEKVIKIVIEDITKYSWKSQNSFD